MIINRKLAIPLVAAGTLVLAACGAPGTPGQPDPFPGEERVSVVAGTDPTQPVSEDVTIGSNGSQLFEVSIPAEASNLDLVWFEVGNANGVESVEIYAQPGLLAPTPGVQLMSIASGWFDVPSAINALPASVPAELSATQIEFIHDCSGPCVALAGSEAGSSRYVRVNATSDGAEFDFYAYGRAFEYEGGLTRSEPVELELAEPEVSAIPLSGTERWFAADNVSSILLTHLEDLEEVAFRAEIFVAGDSVAVLTEGDGFHSFAGPVNDVEISVTTFNETRAAAAGAKRFSIFVE